MLSPLRNERHNDEARDMTSTSIIRDCFDSRLRPYTSLQRSVTIFIRFLMLFRHYFAIATSPAETHHDTAHLIARVRLAWSCPPISKSLDQKKAHIIHVTMFKMNFVIGLKLQRHINATGKYRPRNGDLQACDKKAVGQFPKTHE